MSRRSSNVFVMLAAVVALGACAQTGSVSRSGLDAQPPLTADTATWGLVASGS
ncbi:MAG: hypothetical protein AAFR93_07575 [Pseudomonadota bacterium]